MCVLTAQGVKIHYLTADPYMIASLRQKGDSRTGKEFKGPAK